jgi:histone-lysine N-methyltransferase ASH1L
MKLENVEPASADVPGGRVRRARTSVGTYNVKVLAGTSIHAPKKYSKDPDVIEARRRKLLGETIEGTPHAAESQGEAAGENADNLDNGGTIALDVRAPVEKAPRTRKRLSLGDSPKKTAKQRDLARRKSMRSPKNEIESISKRMSLLGKRDRKIFEEDLAGLAKAKRELKNLADTPEFAKIELKPVIHEVWSNGKLVKEERPKKKKKTMTEEAPSPKSKAKETKEKNEPSVEKEPDEPKSFVRKPKTYLTKGLYAGQETRNLDWFAHDSGEFRKKMDDVAPYRPNTFMPLPMWHGQRLLQVGRHFQLPFDVCSPLPPGQPKPDEWRKTSSSKMQPAYKFCLNAN